MRANSQPRSVKVKIDDMKAPVEQDSENLFSGMPIPEMWWMVITIADGTRELSSARRQNLLGETSLPLVVSSFPPLARTSKRHVRHGEPNMTKLR